MTWTKLSSREALLDVRRGNKWSLSAIILRDGEQPYAHCMKRLYSTFLAGLPRICRNHLLPVSRLYDINGGRIFYLLERVLLVMNVLHLALSLLAVSAMKYRL